MLEISILLILSIGIGVLIAGIMANSGTKEAAPPPVQGATPQVRRVLAIDGTDPFKGSVNFVKSFGIAPEQLQELRVFVPSDTMEGADLPQEVRDCIATAYSLGACRGLEVPNIVEKGRQLIKGEALYFALVTSGMNASVMTFVDRARTEGTA